VGAPPDALFTGGQNWGLPPLHPERVRAGGHALLRACVAAHAEPAAILRVDHVMGLHRLYWIPEGAAATEGAYVRQPVDELYAVLCLESVRARCAIAGEDLGTVPPEVRPQMAARGLHRLFVAQFNLPAAEGKRVPPATPDAVASLNTHDTPTFAGWWAGAEIDDRVELGLLTEAQAVDESTARRVQRRSLATALLAGLDPGALAAGDELLAAVMAALTEHLARGPAQLVQVTLEDLWLEPRPQNTPGTGPERPNWRRRHSRTLPAIAADPAITDLLRRLSAHRPR
jgi:4-alpha-glucanotransferase